MKIKRKNYTSPQDLADKIINYSKGKNLKEIWKLLCEESFRKKEGIWSKLVTNSKTNYVHIKQHSEIYYRVQRKQSHQIQKILFETKKPVATIENVSPINS